MLVISALNLHTANWDSQFISESFSAYLSIIFIVMISIGPLLNILALCKRPSLWKSQKFMDRYGTLTSDLDPKKK